MADYDVPFGYFDYYKYENIQTLTLLSYYLSVAPSQNEILEYIVDFNTRYQVFDRKLEYIGLNGLFCGVNGEALEDFKTDFLPSLAAVSADDLPWGTDSTVLEVNAEYLIREMENDINNYADFVGKQYLEILETQAAYKDRFIESGRSPEEADAIIADIDTLEQNSDKIIFPDKEKVDLPEKYVELLNWLTLYRGYVEKCDAKGALTDNSTRYMMQYHMLQSIKECQAQCWFPTDDFAESQIFANEEIEKVKDILDTRFGLRYN